MYKNLGYFSLIGLLRLHCQLGDYYQALQSVDNVQLSKKVEGGREGGMKGEGRRGGGGEGKGRGRGGEEEKEGREGGGGGEGGRKEEEEEEEEGRGGGGGGRKEEGRKIKRELVVTCPWQ